MKALVIIVTIIGLSAVIGSIIVGNMVFDGKVVDKPYETGLIYDEIQKEKSKFRLEILNKDFKRGKNEFIFMLEDNLGRPKTDSHIVLMISRPSTTRYDREIPLSYFGDGKYRAEVYFPLHGHWDIKARLLNEPIPIVLEERVYAKDN